MTIEHLDRFVDSDGIARQRAFCDDKSVWVYHPENDESERWVQVEKSLPELQAELDAFVSTNGEALKVQRRT